MRIGSSLWSCLGIFVVLNGIISDSAAQALVTSPTVGIYRMALLGDSDTVVSFPFARPAAAYGRIASVTESTVTLAGSPAWQPDQFVYAAGVQTNHYFMLVLSGANEGNYYPITSSGANSVGIEENDYSIAGLATGDRVAIIPYWSLGSVFPAGQGVHTSTSPFIRRTEILIPDHNGAGINLSAAKTYYFINGQWRLYGSSTDRSDDVLLPDSYFVVRHNNSTDTTLTLRGGVVMTKWCLPLNARSQGKQDNLVALPRPAALTLDESGLIESGAFTPSLNRFNRADELFVFDNTVKLKNKSASATYFYYNGQWEKFGSPSVNAGSDAVFKPGCGYVIRKNAGTSRSYWVNQANY